MCADLALVRLPESATAAGAVPITPTMGLEDLGKLELASREGVAIHLRDVATLRHEHVHEGSQAWAGGKEAELWVVEADDADAVRQAVDAAAVAAPPEVSLSVAGELVPRGCASPASQRMLDGDFELLEFALPAGSEPSRFPELIGRAPTGLAERLPRPPGRSRWRR